MSSLALASASALWAQLQQAVSHGALPLLCMAWIMIHCRGGQALGASHCCPDSTSDVLTPACCSKPAQHIMVRYSLNNIVSCGMRGSTSCDDAALRDCTGESAACLYWKAHVQHAADQGRSSLHGPTCQAVRVMTCPMVNV